MQYSKPIPILELKAVDDDWLVEGYVSTFGNTDLGADMVMQGAFTDTLKSGPKVRFLLSHDPRLVLGPTKRLKEDSKGLFGSFKISKTQLGSDTHQLLLDGAIDSFSIGYQAMDWEIVDKEVRQLKKIELYEASLVPIPMNQEAIVTGVKDYMTMAGRINMSAEELTKLFDEIRGLTEKGQPLNEAKRKELEALLETFSGLDDVRATLTSVLAPSQSKLVEPKLISYQLAEARKRLSTILQE